MHTTDEAIWEIYRDDGVEETLDTFFGSLEEVTDRCDKLELTSPIGERFSFRAVTR